MAGYAYGRTQMSGVEENEQKILSIWTLMLLICILNNSNPFHYLNRGNKLSMEENGSSVGKTMELIGTSSAEGLDKLRTLRMVESSICTETQVWPGWHCTRNAIFPKWPIILLLNSVPSLILLFLNNANIQAPHHQNPWIQVGEFRGDCLFHVSWSIVKKSPCKRNPIIADKEIKLCSGWTSHLYFFFFFFQETVE